MRERDTANEASIEPSQTYIMECFCKNSEKLLAVNYFHKKVPPWIFDRVLNATVSYYDGISYNHTKRSEIQVKY